jgi:hypothetical protein
MIEIYPNRPLPISEINKRHYTKLRIYSLKIVPQQRQRTRRC